MNVDLVILLPGIIVLDVERCVAELCFRRVMRRIKLEMPVEL
jgi:hypothetical protein